MERYRLAPVRDARGRDERVKRGDLAAAVTHARAGEADVEAARARVDAAAAAVAAARATSGTTANALARREQFTARLRRDLELARAAHDRAVASHAGQLAALDDQRARLARARADREVIERHFERWRTDQRKIAERRAE
jgi:hypothetical protein